MGALPLQFSQGDHPEKLGLDGTEFYSIDVDNDIKPRQKVPVTARKADGSEVKFETVCRIDTPVEVDYYRNGGILHTVLRKFMNE
ncbi:MAG: hypothetical protein LC662_03295 [Rhodothermaceae bacterium]|nr:hypothetical protein [Rhodothermaceae bacterium]